MLAFFATSLKSCFAAVLCCSVGASIILPLESSIVPKYLLNVRVAQISTVTSWMPLMFETNGPIFGPKANKPITWSFALPPIPLLMLPYFIRAWLISLTVWFPINQSTVPAWPKSLTILLSKFICIFLIGPLVPPCQSPPVFGLTAGISPVSL